MSLLDCLTEPGRIFFLAVNLGAEGDEAKGDEDTAGPGQIIFPAYLFMNRKDKTSEGVVASYLLGGKRRRKGEQTEGMSLPLLKLLLLHKNCPQRWKEAKVRENRAKS